MLEVVLAVTIFHSLSAIVLITGCAIGAVASRLGRTAPKIRAYVLSEVVAPHYVESDLVESELAQAA
jgi:uncharacterized membrane-anchored protein YhcB (DUF1043 family)